MKKLFVLFAAAILALVSVSCMKQNGEESQSHLEINATTLAGTWEGGVQADYAQGYEQKWRITFDGKNYTFWHTHMTAGSTQDEVQGVKTVGNKESGTWEYTGGMLVFTPQKQFASYYLTMNPDYSLGGYVYYNYNPETMEADEWYETNEVIIKDGIARDLADGTEWFISKWRNVILTEKVLSVKINMDTFKLEKTPCTPASKPLSGS